MPEADYELIETEPGSTPLADPMADALLATGNAIARIAKIPEALHDMWIHEMRMISLAAAAHGDYDSALKGYEKMGEAHGYLGKAAQQHVHFHGGDPALVREAPTSDLEKRLADIRASNHTPVDGDPTQAIGLEELLA